MNVPLALGLVLVTSIVCGVALWPAQADAAAAPRPLAPVPAPAPEPVLLAGLEADVARAALAVMATAERSRAVVAPTVDASVMLARRVPAAAVVVGAGIPLAELAELPRQLLVRLLRHAATTLTGDHAGPELARLDARLRAGVTFAWAGELRAGAPFYLRLHGDEFVVEWVARDDGVVHAAWRDFVRDADRPYLGETVFRKTSR